MRGMSNERFCVSTSFKIKQRNKRSNSKFKQKSNQAQNRDKFIQLEFEFFLKYEGGLLLRHVLNPNNRWNNLAIGKVCQLWLFTQVAYSTERKECQHFLHRCGVKANKIDRANKFTKTLTWTKVNIHPSIQSFFFYYQVKLSKKMKEYWTFKILYDIHSFDVHNSTLVSALTLSWYSLYIMMRWSKRKQRSLNHEMK